MSQNKLNLPLMDSEEVVYQGKINPLFRGAAILGIIGLAVSIKSPPLGIFILLGTAITAIGKFIKLKTSIFLITNKRVIIRVGVFTHRSLELNLNKIESVYVQTGILDRANKMGTLVVAGTGGTKEAFKELADPQTFKIKLQEELDKTANGTGTKVSNG
jgi:uncharacterized membrane protein YdbT with pleckstrin-like domain